MISFDEYWLIITQANRNLAEMKMKRGSDGANDRRSNGQSSSPRLDESYDTHGPIHNKYAADEEDDDADNGDDWMEVDNDGDDDDDVDRPLSPASSLGEDKDGGRGAGGRQQQLELSLIESTMGVLDDMAEKYYQVDEASDDEEEEEEDAKMKCERK